MNFPRAQSSHPYNEEAKSTSVFLKMQHQVGKQLVTAAGTRGMELGRQGRGGRPRAVSLKPVFFIFSSHWEVHVHFKDSENSCSEVTVLTLLSLTASRFPCVFDKRFMKLLCDLYDLFQPTCLLNGKLSTFQSHSILSK